MKHIRYNGHDGSKINTYVFEGKTSGANVVIVHDLKENPEFYFTFAQHLQKKGYNASVVELKHHFKNQNDIQNVDPKNLTSATGDYFKDNVNNLFAYLKIIKNTSNEPIIIIAQGLSTYLAIRLMEICDMVNVAILIGSGQGQDLKIQAGKLAIVGLDVLGTAKFFKKQIEALLFSSLKSHSKNRISTNDKYYETYISDHNYTQELPHNYYTSYLKNIISNDKNLRNISKDAFIMLLSGAKDPVSNKGKNVINLYKQLSQNDLQAEYHLFKDMYHNLLNETDQKQVFNFITDYLKQVLK